MVVHRSNSPLNADTGGERHTGAHTFPALHSTRLESPDPGRRIAAIIDTETTLLAVPPLLTPPSPLASPLARAAHITWQPGQGQGQAGPPADMLTRIPPSVETGLDLLSWIRRAVITYALARGLPTQILLYPADHRLLIAGHLPYRFYSCPRQGHMVPIPYITSTAVTPGTILCRHARL